MSAVVAFGHQKLHGELGWEMWEYLIIITPSASDGTDPELERTNLFISRSSSRPTPEETEELSNFPGNEERRESCGRKTHVKATRKLTGGVS